MRATGSARRETKQKLRVHQRAVITKQKHYKRARTRAFLIPSGEEVSAPIDDWEVIEVLASGWPKSSPASWDQLGVPAVTYAQGRGVSVIKQKKKSQKKEKKKLAKDWWGYQDFDCTSGTKLTDTFFTCKLTQQKIEARRVYISTVFCQNPFRDGIR